MACDLRFHDLLRRMNFLDIAAGYPLWRFWRRCLPDPVFAKFRAVLYNNQHKLDGSLTWGISSRWLP